MGLLNRAGNRESSRLGEVYIEAKAVGLRYEPTMKRDDIQSLVYRSLLRREKRSPVPKTRWALKNVDFVAQAGDIVGVIGPNGAGKTTLCKVIAGILRPDTGSLTVKGEVFSLLSLGTGFNPELTGRENVFLNGMMLGWSRSEMKDLMSDIVAFAELGEFIDQPLKTYSAGMKARLGFSIAVMAEPDIILVDETLSVGDVHFTKKAAAKLEELVQKAKLVVVVTHGLGFVEQFCTKSLWLEKGEVRGFGNPKEIVGQYRASIPQRRSKPQAIWSLSVREERHAVSPEPVVEAKGVSVAFPRKGSGRHSSLYWALRDLSFTVYQGDILGVIGRNGAGKTTLARLLSGILQPDTGNLTVKGQTTALLTLGAGFNHQLSGKDNIFLNGMMLGISRQRLEELYGDIVAFSGLAGDIHRPIKQYSSGMISRLSFSVAAMIEPDILIVDEVLAVGDLAFYEKASAKMQELMHKAKAVIVVTHDMAFVSKICTRALWLENGLLKAEGPAEEVVERYTNSR